MSDKKRRGFSRTSLWRFRKRADSSQLPDEYTSSSDDEGNENKRGRLGPSQVLRNVQAQQHCEGPVAHSVEGCNRFEHHLIAGGSDRSAASKQSSCASKGSNQDIFEDSSDSDSVEDSDGNQNGKIEAHLVSVVGTHQRQEVSDDGSRSDSTSSDPDKSARDTVSGDDAHKDVEDNDTHSAADNDVRENTSIEEGSSGSENSCSENSGSENCDSGNSDSESSVNNEEPAAQEDENLHVPLYDGASITLSESLVALMTFALNHSLTGTCLADLLLLISLHCPPSNQCKKTLYKFKKCFTDMGRDVLKFQHFCNGCLSLLPSKETVCANCNSEETSKSYFIEIPLQNQLQTMFGRPDFFEHLQYRFTRVKKSQNNIEDIYDGAVYREHVNRGFLSDPQSVSFMFYWDGVQKHKNSRISLWPIYLVINELNYKKRTQKENILLAGLWFGNKKPHVNTFLAPLHSTMDKFHKEGFLFYLPAGQEIRVKGTLLCGTCDLPAKSMLMNFKQFNDNYGCANCYIKGEEYDLGNRNSVHVYPYSPEIKLRSDEEVERFARVAVASGQSCYGVKGPSVIFYLLLFMIRSIGIDAMHGIFSGVGKLLLQLLFQKSHRFSPFSLYHVVHVVNDRMKRIRPPSFLHRMPQPVDDLSHWKSLDYKVWLLYYSVPSLRYIMNNEYFAHHMKLVSAVALLMQRSISLAQIERARLLLHEYVNEFQTLFGLRYMVMNIHQLLHLPDVVLNLGPLWVYSCYFFEDLNGKLFKFVHGTRHAGIQVCSAVSIYINLSHMIEKLNPDSSVRKFSERIHHTCQKFKVAERISPSVFSVGTYSLAAPLARNFQEMLRESFAFQGRSVQKFLRLMNAGVMFVSEEYTRVKSSLSCAVSFIVNNESQLVVVKYFLRLSNCVCTQKCLCLPATFAAVILKYRRVVWEVHSAANINMFHLSKVEKSNNIVVIPVNAIKCLCFYLEINENSRYFVEPINTLETE